MGSRFCYEEECTKDDPLSQEVIRTLAEPLPFAKHIHSKLVCYISKEPMNEDNPPLVLPNGYVYSSKVCLCKPPTMICVLLDNIVSVSQVCAESNWEPFRRRWSRWQGTTKAPSHAPGVALFVDFQNFPRPTFHNSLYSSLDCGF